MKKCSYMIYLFLLLASAAYSYPFVVPYFDEEFFLYPFLNYDQSLEWKRARENNLYENGFIQTSHGSLTTWMLLRSEEAVFNTDIGDDFTFRFRYRSHENRHLSYDEHISSAGLGYRINPNFSITAETELSSEKSEIDLKPGILFTFQTVYAHLGVSFDDFLFDKKNIGAGKNNSLPLTFTADIKFDFNRLYFFFSGRYGTGFDRKWGSDPYAELISHKNHKRDLYARAEYDITDRFKVFSESFFDSFYDEKELKDSTLDISSYKFDSKLTNYKFGAILCLNEKNIIDAGAGFANTEHSMDVIEGTRRSYRIYYSALLPYLLYSYEIHSKFTIRAGYMGSYTTDEKTDHYFTAASEVPMNEYWDKDLVKLGLEYRFSPNASLYISAGQLVNTGVFGGGNARFNLIF
jgi:hypothetical protein